MSGLTSEREQTTSVRVLLVCRANLCRSPIAARMLEQRLAEGGATAVVDSAGLDVADTEAETGLVENTREWGIDLSSHRSRQLRADDLRLASIVLAMEHHQVNDVIALDAGAWPKTFTLKEVVRRAQDVGPRREKEHFDEWVARVHRGRTPLGLVGAWHDDVSDPAGRPSSELERTLAELDVLTSRFVDVAWPRVRKRWRR